MLECPTPVSASAGTVTIMHSLITVLFPIAVVTLFLLGA